MSLVRMISFQTLIRKRMSASSFCDSTPSATVRTMKPVPSGRILSTISRSLRRSPSLSMRREMPMWSTVGMKTR